MSGDAALGLAIKARRMFIGLSQEELAAIVEVDPISVSRYETGRQALNTQRLGEIATALRTAPAVLHEIAERVAYEPLPALNGRSRGTGGGRRYSEAEIAEHEAASARRKRPRKRGKGGR